MSEFIKALEMKFLPGRMGDYMGFPNLTVSSKVESVPFTTRQEYVIEVTWRQSGYCPMNNKQVIYENSIRAFTEAVYGDLRKRIIDLERAVYDRDGAAVESAIRDILRETGP